jgi:hypothetical protein
MGLFFAFKKTHKKLTNTDFFIQISQVNRSFFLYFMSKDTFFKKVLTQGIFSLYYASSLRAAMPELILLLYIISTQRR